MDELTKYSTISELLRAVELFNDTLENVQRLDDTIFTYALLYDKQKGIYTEKFQELMMKKKK